MSSNQTISAHQVSALLLGLKLPMGLMVDEVQLDAPSVTVEKEPFSASSPQDPKVTAIISSTSLEAFLEKQAPGGLRNFKVKIDDKIRISASVRMIIEIKANIVCHLEIVDGSKLIVVLDDVGIVGVGAKNLVQQQIDKVNPLLDTSTLPIHVTLDNVELSEDKVALIASLQLNSLNQLAK